MPSLKLERSAKRLKRKRSDVVRLALEQFLEAGPQTRPIERVRDLLGRWKAACPTSASATASICSGDCAVASELLLDTGAFVALVDKSERRHADCVAVLEGWSGTIVTTEAVLTETLHLVGPRWQAQKLCIEFLLRGAFVLVPASQASLARVAALMEKYRNVPMDYADATLVALAEELATDLVFTLDRRGFSAYRLTQRRGFQLMP